MATEADPWGPRSSHRYFTEGQQVLYKPPSGPGPTQPRKRPGTTQASPLPPPFPLVPQDRGLIQELGTPAFSVSKAAASQWAVLIYDRGLCAYCVQRHTASPEGTTHASR